MNATTQIVDTGQGKTYRNLTLGYSVDVGRDGSIEVKSGDWVSKYSAAIYDNFWQWEDFGRLRGPNLIPVTAADPNLIQAGEILFHIPTAQHSGTTEPPSSGTPSRPSDEDKINRTAQAIANELQLPGNNLPRLKTVLRLIGPINAVGSVVGAIGHALKIGAIIGEGAVLGGAITGLGIAAPFALAAGGIIGVCDAWEEGLRLFGLKSGVYSLTTLAFEPMRRLPPPAGQLREVAQAHAHRAEDFRQKYIDTWNEAWIDTRSAVVQKLPPGVSMENFRTTMRAFSQDNPQVLAKKLWEAIGAQDTLGKHYASTINYPN